MSHFVFSDVSIRPARTGEAVSLSALCLRSKAYWGYDAQFLALCRETLGVSEEEIARGCVVVAVDQSDRPVGVGSILIDGRVAELDVLFVEPGAIGSGIGRALFARAVAMARRCGCREMTIAADPFAASFYEAQGAVFSRMVPSDAIPGRELPLYRYAVE